MGYLDGDLLVLDRIGATAPIAVRSDIDRSSSVKGQRVFGWIGWCRILVIVVTGLLPFPSCAGNFLGLDLAAGYQR